MSNKENKNTHMKSTKSYLVPTSEVVILNMESVIAASASNSIFVGGEEMDSGDLMQRSQGADSPWDDDIF